LSIQPAYNVTSSTIYYMQMLQPFRTHLSQWHSDYDLYFDNNKTDDR
jgi:hypothetical protein